MEEIRELIRKANDIGKDREEAISAMIKLAQIYGSGEQGVKPDLLKALNWAEKAAYEDSPDGYLEITRIIGSACIATTDYKLKMKYVTYILGTCDADTLRQFNRADIAYNCGSICEYMARYHDKIGSVSDRNVFDIYAGDYFLIALHAAGSTNLLKQQISAAFDRTIARNISSDSRPLFSPRVYAETYAMH
jgi:hypothetical protein